MARKSKRARISSEVEALPRVDILGLLSEMTMVEHVKRRILSGFDRYELKNLACVSRRWREIVRPALDLEGEQQRVSI